MIDEERPYKTLSEIEGFVENYYKTYENIDFKEYDKVLSAILNINEETVQETFNKIIEYKNHMENLINFIEYALKIRPKQSESICSLLALLYKSNYYTPNKKLLREHKVILIKKGVPFKGFKCKIDKRENLHDKIEDAIKEDNVEKFIKLSLEPGFNPNMYIYVTKVNPFYFVYGYKYPSCMQLMAFYGSIKCFKFALMDGFFDCDSLVLYAIAGGNKEIIKLLEQENESFDFCFETSIKYHRYDIGDWLLNNYKCSFLGKYNVVDYRSVRCLFFLLKNNPNGLKQKEIDELFSKLINEHLLSLAHYIVDTYTVNIDALYHKKTLLYTACDNNWLETVKFLVETCKANIDIKDNRGITAIHCAAEKGYNEVVKYLISHNASITSYDIEEAESNIKEYLKKCLTFHIMCKKGANFSSFSKYDPKYSGIKLDGKTLLHYACEKGNLDLAKFLINECKMNVDEIDDSGKTAFHIACEKSNANIAKYLVKECNIDPNEKVNGYSALHIASKKGNLKIVKMLIEECGANIEERTEMFKETALYLAKISEKTEIVKYLEEKTNDLNKK